MAFATPTTIRLPTYRTHTLGETKRLIWASAAPTRRSFISAAAASLLVSLRETPVHAFAAVGQDPDQTNNTNEEYSEYHGPVSLGFSFQYPTNWKVNKKPIKTHLSEIIVTSKNVPGTSAGLVVDEVKISSIDKFGSALDVGEKVVALERKKESTQSAQLLSSKVEKHDGLVYYVVDYVVDSTRGAKHYLAKATITAKQLYVFTAQCRLDNFEGDSSTLEYMIDSFIVRPQFT